MDSQLNTKASAEAAAMSAAGFGIAADVVWQEHFGNRILRFEGADLDFRCVLDRGIWRADIRAKGEDWYGVEIWAGRAGVQAPPASSACVPMDFVSHFLAHQGLLEALAVAWSEELSVGFRLEACESVQRVFRGDGW